jgi:hypothetical protein
LKVLEGRVVDEKQRWNGEGKGKRDAVTRGETVFILVWLTGS